MVCFWRVDVCLKFDLAVRFLVCFLFKNWKAEA